MTVYTQTESDYNKKQIHPRLRSKTKLDLKIFISEYNKML